MKSVDQMIQWYYDKMALGITYSMVQRNGPSSYDCSSAGYYALKQGGYFPGDFRIGNTDSAFGDLERNGWTQLQPNAQGNYDTQRGDQAIWGKRGASSGAFGHYMIFVNANDVIHCNSFYNGIHINNYDQLAGWNGNPEQTFYRYTGEVSTQPSVTNNNPSDQSVEVGSFIKFADSLLANDVQLIGGVYQVQTDSLCPTGFTWDDNGIPAEPLIEVDADGYATADQSLDTGSHYKLPSKYQVFDLGLTDGHWMAQIEWNGLKFWVDIASATEVASTDGGTPTPVARPVETPAPTTPEAPVVTTPTVDPVPVEPTEPTKPAEPPVTEEPKPIEPTIPKEEDMAFTQEQQKELAVATQSAQVIVDKVASSDVVQELVGGVSKKVKLSIYVAGDALIGLGLIVPSLGVVLGWTDVVRIVALSGVLSTAGSFILVMFGIFKAGSK